MREIFALIYVLITKAKGYCTPFSKALQSVFAVMVLTLGGLVRAISLPSTLMHYIKSLYMLIFTKYCVNILASSAS